MPPSRSPWGGGANSTADLKDGSGNSADIVIPNNSASANAGALSGTRNSTTDGVLGTSTRFDNVLSFDGSTPAEMAKLWQDAVSKTGTVYIILEKDWEADATTGSFGTGTGFGPTGGIEVPANKKIAINLNGNKINRKLTTAVADGSVITVKPNASFEITGSGTVTGGFTTTNGGGIYCEGDLYISGGTIDNNIAGASAGSGAGGGIYTKGSSKFTMTGGTVSNNKAYYYAGGISAEGSLFTMSGGSVSGNDAPSSGGVYICATTSTFSGGSVTSNNGLDSMAPSASGAGTSGGLGVESTTLKMTGGIVSGNTSTKNGGGILVGNKGTLQLSGGTISNNTCGAGYNGGGIMVQGGGNLVMSGGTITNNISSAAGALGSTGSTVTLVGGEIVNNSACKAGIMSGGTTSKYYLYGCTVSGNPIGFNTTTGDTIEVAMASGNITAPVIIGNTTSNLVLGSNKITIAGALGNNESGGGYSQVCIGVTAANGTIITTGNFKAQGINAANGNRYFPVDGTSSILTMNGNELMVSAATASMKKYVATWQYTDGLGVVHPISDGVMELTYGDVVSKITAKVNGVDYNWTPTGHTGSEPIGSVSMCPEKNGVNGCNYQYVEGVGKYLAFVNYDTSTMCVANCGIKIVVRPKPITINIDSKTAAYGESDKPLTWQLAPGSTYANSDSDATLSPDITLTRAAGDSVGSYLISGKYAGVYYDVTFVNANYTITPTTVNVLINDQKVTFGSKYYNVRSDLNTTQDDNGTPGDTTDDFYNGGWQYAPGNVNTFLAADLASGSKRYPLSISCIYTPAPPATAIDITNSSNSDFIPAGKYIIQYKASPEYNITFTSANSALDSTTNASNDQGVLEVQKAKITVAKNGSNKYEQSWTKAQATSGKKIEITTTITIQGDTTKPVKIEYADPIYCSTDEKAVAPTAPELNTTSGNYEWKDGKDATGTALSGVVGWQDVTTTTATTALTKTASGTYKVFFKLSADNHEDLIQEWTMIIQSTSLTVTLVVEKDSVPSGTWTALAASTNAVYGDTIRANIDYTAPALSGVTAGSITNYTMYYVGTGTTDYGKWDAATDQNTADLTDKISVVDSTKHKDYGTTAAPTGAGTYKATLVGKAGEYDFGTTKPTLNFTIDKKKITTAPTRSGTTVLTYNGSAQGFKISNFDDTTMEYVAAADYITPSTDVKESLDDTKFTSADNWTLEGTNAYDYLAGFKLKDNDNYEWDSSLSANLKSYTDTSVTPNKTYNIYELKLTINKAKLKVDFTSPQKNADSTKNDRWDWEPDEYDTTGGEISYEIQSSCIIGTENVTVSMIYVEIPASGAVAVGDWQNVSGSELTANGYFEIKDVAKGKYYVSVKLKDDSAGDDVNKNYTIARNETTGEYTNCTQVFEVTDGTASVSSIKWQYTYTLGIDKETKDLDGATIKYQRNGKVGNYLPVEYTVSVIAKSLPDYLEVKTDWTGDATKGVGLSGWSGGYNSAKQTNANAQKADKSYEKYSSYVALKIKDKDEDGNNIDMVFSNTSTDYTYIDDKTCELKVEWTIEKGTLDLDGMLWGYTVGADTTTVKEFRAVPKKDADGNKVPLMVDGGTVQATDEDGNLLYVTVHETDAQGNSKIIPVIKDTGYSKDVLTVSTYSGDGFDNNVNKSKIGSALLTRVSFTLVDTNYEEPDEYEFEWAVTNATLSISGWNTTTGTVEIGGEKYKTPVVTSTDPDIAQKVEYVYTYKDDDGNDVTATLDELWKKVYKDIADGKPGKIENITVQVKAKAGYQLDSSKPESTYKRVVTIGESGTTITVSTDKKSGEYGKASIKITLKDIGGDDMTAETDIYYIEVFDKDGNSLGELGNGADLTKLSAGTYKIKIVIRDGMTEDYSVKAGEDEITFVITPIELELPTLKNPVFDGSDINVTVGDYLDETTLGYLSSKLISFTGDTSARNTGKTYLLKVNIVDTVNYVWKEESGTVPARFTLLAEETVITAERKSGELAHLNWEVQPLVITEKMMTWKGLNSKNGAQLVLNLKEGINYKIEYKYYTDLEGGSEVTETKAGDRVYVAAILGGEDAELGNIVFAKAEAETNGLMLAERQSHTVPKSSIAAVAGNALNFVKSNWLWFVIALAILIFLIILICIIRHRKKTKEERLAKKEAEKEKKEEEKRKKEEEKQRKEEERIRKEEEREAAKQKQQAELEAQKAKQQAELELAKAKQEAELAKIKAQAGMAGAGVAAMAMAQQPQQQQMPMPQQQPMQQPQAQPQSYQAPAQAQPPMQQQPYPQMQAYDGGAIARLEEEFKAMRNEQRTDAKLENELLKLRLDMKDGQQPQAQQQPQQQPAYPQMPFMPFNPYMPMNGMYGMPQTNVPDANMLAEKFGLMMATMMKNMGVQAPSSEPVAAIKSAEESKPVSVAYPPDAVVTTTTTVDTTKNVAPKRSREDELRALDIDGFYDTFEENK